MKNFTTRMMAIGLSMALLTAGIAACKVDVNTSGTSEPTITEVEVPAGGQLVGGWTIAEATEVTAELKAIFDDAIGQLDGYMYEPVAYLGSQVVSGTNHCFLCKSTIIAANATCDYCITYINQGPTGENSFLKDDHIILPGTESGEMLAGGWAYTESAEVTPELEEVVEKAASQLTGATYKAVANIGSQVVAGVNHAVLCQVTPVVPDATSSYALVYIYEDLDGNCTITETTDINISI